MHNIFDCVKSFIPLLDTEYHLVLGRKGVAASLSITFDKKDCFHLMGLQYLTDKPELNRDRGKIFDKIATQKITPKQIESSDLYYKIKDRINMLPYLEFLLDSNDTIFKYNQSIHTFSMIQAEYLMKSRLEEHSIFIFLSKNPDNKYYCRSFFPETNKDYTKNQSSWTLLQKSKLQRSTGIKNTLYDRLSKE